MTAVHHREGDSGVKCKFGRFGSSPAIYLNSSTVRCVTPKINDEVI